MDITHTFSFPLHINPSRLDPCISREWIALPLTKNVVGLWKTAISHLEKSHPIELKGHDLEICYLTFSNRFPTRYIASACKEKIIVWDIDLKVGNIDTTGITSYKTFYHKAGEIYAMCFNNFDNILALAADCKILILNLMPSEPISFFDAHRAMITKLKFCPHYSATLVSISDDRSFCVWNVTNKTLLYQSTIISSSPLLSLSMNLVHPQVVMGTADGCVKIFDLTDGNNFRHLYSLDLSMTIKKRFESDSKLQNDSLYKEYNHNLMSDLSLNNVSADVQSSESILSVEFMYFTQNQCQESINQTDPTCKSSSIMNILQEQPPSLCVVTTNAIILINSKTFEITDIVSFQTPLKSLSFSSSITVGRVAYAGLNQTNAATLIAVVGEMMCNKINILTCVVLKKNKFIALDDGEKHDVCLSIVPKTSLFPTSPLSCKFFPPVNLKTVPKGGQSNVKKNSSSSLNQPVTFKSKIKSSGYLQAPRTSMFTPHTDKKSLLHMNTSSMNRSSNDKRMLANKTFQIEYDISKGPPVDYCGSLQIDAQATAVSCLRFSDDGKRLGCSLTNKLGLLIKSPFSEELSTPLIRHNNTVNSVYWSNSNSYILTGSSDKTVCLWSIAGGDPLLRLTHQGGSLKESTQGRSSASTSASSRGRYQVKNTSSPLPRSHSIDNLPYTKEIKNAQFFYVDKFIIVAHGPELCLYNYEVTNEKDDIKSYQSKNYYKLKFSWQTSSSAFTSIAAVNTFYSYLVICATTGRNIEIFDLNKSLLAHNFVNCHTRPSPCVAINESSCFSSQPQEALNVFATTAPTDSIKLWDIRSKSNVLSMQGHVNKAHSCQIAFSPCGNYIAAGSEDRMVYMYDLRMGTYCDRLRGHNEVVTSVAFHPAKPLLASGKDNVNKYQMLTLTIYTLRVVVK
ncbi:hypothetical protein Btru_061808 [Bulinus truncatus]|nr:hypothetical protein Btru_061808 [Bulinus truncatus]